jgi:hypothetical protein
VHDAAKALPGWFARQASRCPLPAKSATDKRMGLIFGHNADIV